MINITFNNPVTFTPPSFTRKDGMVRSFQPVTLTGVDLEVKHKDSTKKCFVRFPYCADALTLWSGDDYESSKNLSDDQHKERILELLGNNPSSVLESLFPTAK